MMATAQEVPVSSHLVEVGPVSPDHGFPIWYKDATNLSLELCLDPNDPLCGGVGAAMPDPTQPVSFPDNFPDEAFWWSATAVMDAPGGGRALLVLAAEAAFTVGAPAPGDQIAFGRVRIRVDNLTPGATYRVIHPYGADVFTNVAGGDRGINFTEDIGIDTGFSGLLQSRIGPFLRWDPITDAPPGYVGNPNVDHRVSGSPFGTNFFRIEGPNIRDPASPFRCPDRPTSVDCLQTDLFSLQGKVATIAGVAVTRATYTRTTAGTSIDVFAFSQPEQTMEVRGTGITTTPMRSDGLSQYYARVSTTGARPASVTVVNTRDLPPSVMNVPLQDLISITRAEYDVALQQLTIVATSSDAVGAPTLTADVFGPLANGTLVMTGLAIPPAQVTVRSSLGGSTTRLVDVVQGTPPGTTVVANAGLDRTVAPAAQVTLDGRGSTGPSTGFSWRQVSGTSVVLSGGATSVATFTAPSVAGPLVFELTVTSAGGPVTDQVTISVQTGTPPPAGDAAPTVRITAPSDGARLATRTVVDIRASASDDRGLRAVEFSVDGVLLRRDTTAPIWKADWTAAAGQHTLTATAEDTAGQRTSHTITVCVGTSSSCTVAPPPPPPPPPGDTPPSVGWLAPTNGATLTAGTTFDMRASASDATGVRAVEFLVDGVLLRRDTTDPIWKADWVVTRGTHTLTVIAEDTVGQRTSSSIQVNVP